MQIVQCAALLLPLILCSDSSKPSSTREERLQIQLHNSKTTTTFLKPLDLKNKEGWHEDLLPYGFIINTNEVTPRKITVENQTLGIPQNAKALLITVPKSKGKLYSQDIQITSLPYFGLQLLEFQTMKLKENHVPIYLQFADTPVIKLGQMKTPKLHNEKIEEHQPEPLLSDSRNYPKDGVVDTAQSTALEVLEGLGRQQNWPILAICHVETTNVGLGAGQFLDPLTQTTNRCLDSNYFSFPWDQESDIVYLKIQDKLIPMTKKERHESHIIIIEMEIIRKNGDELIRFPNPLHYILRDATSEEIENLPDIRGNMYYIYFQFNNSVQSGIDD